MKLTTEQKEVTFTLTLTQQEMGLLADLDGGMFLSSLTEAYQGSANRANLPPAEAAEAFRNLDLSGVFDKVVHGE